MVLSRTTKDNQSVCSDDRRLGIAGKTYRCQEAFRHETSSCVQLHFVSNGTSACSCIEATLTNSFISEISLSTSSINCMMKSTSLCFNISSVWKLVIKNEMS